MSTLLDKAIEKARELPELEQDIAAAELLGSFLMIARAIPATRMIHALRQQ
jgi:hypothetical protein